MTWLDFENKARVAIENELDMNLPSEKVRINGKFKNFDLVNFQNSVVGDVKYYKTTSGGNRPSAKFSILNEYAWQMQLLEKFDDKNLNKIMDINVDAVFRMCRSAIIPMKEQGGGVILNIGSISGIVSNIPQRQVAYNASKAAVHMMTKSLASDFADKNIRVNAIAPGYIRTEMTQGGIDDKEMFPIWKNMTPMGRVGEPEEIAAAALFLCTPASSYVSGEVLVVDGAYVTR